MSEPQKVYQKFPCCNKLAVECILLPSSALCVLQKREAGYTSQPAYYRKGDKRTSVKGKGVHFSELYWPFYCKLRMQHLKGPTSMPEGIEI